MHNLNSFTKNINVSPQCSNVNNAGNGIQHSKENIIPRHRVISECSFSYYVARLLGAKQIVNKITLQPQPTKQRKQHVRLLITIKWAEKRIITKLDWKAILYF